ncbi:hypothetical protein BDF22DRAFT_23871 [Syncephalis plumigaleata]|nr:hypothetical protein BDF22DRAFT_23871 [Syncephalis plumigaleata]
MSTEERIPYNEREEWQDVTPIPQDDGPDPVCPIAYSDEYRMAMDYFRAVSAQREFSERALALTEDIINMNPGHYTIWLYRKDILLGIDADLEKELEFIARMANENPKCYQLWHHRQVIIEHMGDASRELAFIEGALKEDPKNFHAWSYRQWVIKTFGLWENELTYINRLLEEDVRNNSAWNQRYFIIHYKPESVTDKVLQEEVEYTLKQIRWTPSNESAWNYLIG